MIETVYKKISKWSAPALRFSLKKRIKAGKEDADRINERYGRASAPRPEGFLIWIHAASVGESQAALILINELNSRFNQQCSFLITTGTRTSAELMAQRLPQNALHQYAPWDHPEWVKAFMDHWQPHVAFWMESELWPNMLSAIKKRHIPCALINARMSKTSFRNWSRIKKAASKMLMTFDTILCQTSQHQEYFRSLGGHNIIVTDNLKYSASPLPYDPKKHSKLVSEIKKRPVWVFASTHKGEETLACKVHKTLKQHHPKLLTIIVPRHPERRDEILHSCAPYELKIQQRTQNLSIAKDTDIYLADTLGELGLFYAASDIAVIGRSFSNDGGGGHNPIEAALLDCAVLTGPNHQYQQDLFDMMQNDDAVIIAKDEDDLLTNIDALISNKLMRNKMVKNAKHFAQSKANVINHVIDELEPLFLKINMPYIG